MTPEEIYTNLGRLIETTPDLANIQLTHDTHKWLGDAYAFVYELSGVAGSSIKQAIDTLTANAGHTGSLSASRRLQASREIETNLYRAFALAERSVPASVQGSFIPAGNVFDAVKVIAKLTGTAKSDILFVDPYMDDKVLTEFAVFAPEGIVIRLLSDDGSKKPSLEPAGRNWVAQYKNKRPLELKLAPARSIHDRLIIVDSYEAWVLTQSFNALAARAPASIVRFPDPALKISSYDAMWKAAASII